MISRTELIEEQLLREAIRKIIKNKNILSEASANASSPDAPYDITAMNFLRTLLQNILPKLESSYKSLTTSTGQRESFKAHILNGVDELLKTVDTSPETDIEEPIEIEEEMLEDIEIDVGEEDFTDDDEEGFIEIGEEEPEEEPSDEEEFGSGISKHGHDNTGRNAAYSSFKDISTQIENTYAKIDSDSYVAADKVPELSGGTGEVLERKVFKTYLLKNLDLYFDRFEEELQTTPESPDIPV